LDAWLARRPVIPYDTQIARVWGEVAEVAQLRGRARPQNDIWIAACCLRYRVPLVTLNTADFSDLAAHRGLLRLGDREIALFCAPFLATRWSPVEAYRWELNCDDVKPR
jgi:toxin FitB